MNRASNNNIKSLLYDKTDFKANILSCGFISINTSNYVYYALSSDKTLRIFDSNNNQPLLTSDFASPAISSDLHRSGKLLLIGCMDGSIHIISTSTLKILNSIKQHKKYVVVVKWLEDDKFITGSYDHSVTIWKMDANIADSATSAEVTLLKELLFTGTVEAIEIIPNSNNFVVSIRDDNYFHFIDRNTFQVFLFYVHFYIL